MFTYPYPKVETLYRSIAFFASDVSLSKLSFQQGMSKTLFQSGILSVFVH